MSAIHRPTGSSDMESRIFVSHVHEEMLHQALDNCMAFFARFTLRGLAFTLNSFIGLSPRKPAYRPMQVDSLNETPLF